MATGYTAQIASGEMTDFKDYEAVRSSFLIFSGDGNELFSMYTDLQKLRDAAFGRR